MSSGDLAILLILSLLAHGSGDYVIQTDQMATQKTSRWSPALWHAGTYTRRLRRCCCGRRRFRY